MDIKTKKKTLIAQGEAELQVERSGWSPATDRETKRRLSVSSPSAERPRLPIADEGVQRPLARLLAAPFTDELRRFFKSVANDCRTLPEIVGDAKIFAETIATRATDMDRETRQGLAISHDLLLLLAAAKVPQTLDELLIKHEILGRARPLALGHDNVKAMIAAAISADWLRTEAAARPHDPGPGSILH